MGTILAPCGFSRKSNSPHQSLAETKGQFVVAVIVRS